MPNSARKKEVLETLDYSKSILSEATSVYISYIKKLDDKIKLKSEVLTCIWSKLFCFLSCYRLISKTEICLQI